MPEVVEGEVLDSRIETCGVKCPLDFLDTLPGDDACQHVLRIRCILPQSEKQVASDLIHRDSVGLPPLIFDDKNAVGFDLITLLPDLDEDSH